MDPFISLSTVEERELVPGFHARLIHMSAMTIAHFRIEPGSVLPRHQHVHEQVSNILSGEFEMTVGDVTRLCRAGDVVAIPANVPHSGRALTECRVLDVFQPVREDYKG